MTPARARRQRRLAIAGATVLCTVALTACGGSSSATAKHDKKSTAIPVCYPLAKAAMAGFLGIQAAQISTAQSTGTTGNPECSYTTGTGRHKIELVADDYVGPQPYFILERTAIEASQVFVPNRTVPPPQAVKMGIEADWFPAREQLMATDGVKLITTTVSWNGVTQKHRLALAKAFTRPYIKVTKRGKAAAKGFASG